MARQLTFYFKDYQRMKKFILILVLIACGYTGSFAQCMLKVSLTNKQVINVALDGKYFNKKGTSVTVGDLPSGNHYLQIYSLVQKRNGRAREEVIYEGKVSTNEGMITFFEYDFEKGGTIQEQDINSYVNDHPLPPGAPTGNNGNVRDNNNNDNNTAVASQVAVQNIGTLTDSKTDQLKTQVDAKKTDSDKMKILKDALKNEKISTDQVANIMDWLNFESTKLEFAEWTYDLTVDRDNYNLLDAKFSYKNYQDEFDNFIKGKN